MHRTLAKHSFVKTALVLSLVAALSLGAVPRRAEAGSVAIAIKEYALDTIAYITTGIITGNMNRSTADWVNSGFKAVASGLRQVDTDGDGEPDGLEQIETQVGGSTFLIDPQAFFEQLTVEKIESFTTELRNVTSAGDLANTLFPGFSEDLQREIARGTQEVTGDFWTDFQSRLADENLTVNLGGEATYILDAIGEDFNAGGGWATWLELAQCENNRACATLAVENELARQLAQEQAQKQTELDQSGGFLTIRGDCLAYEQVEAIEPGTGNVATVDGECKRYDEVTPGQLIGEQISQASRINIERIAGSDEIGEVIATIFSTALQTLIDEGLSELAGAFGGVPSSDEALADYNQGINEARSEFYRTQNDGTGDPPPPPPNPADPDETPPAVPSVTIQSSGSYWAQINFSSVSEAEGYIIYRFEDKPEIDPETGEETAAPNGILDPDETLEQIAMKSYENGTLDQNRYIDTALQPETTYGYAVESFDDSYNISGRSAFAFASTSPSSEDEKTVDVIPILTFEGGSRGVNVLPFEKDGVYEITYGAYWQPADINVPQFDVVVTVKTGRGQSIPVAGEGSGYYYLTTYGTGSGQQNGATQSGTIVVPASVSKNENGSGYITVELRADASNKVREANEDNTETMRLYLEKGVGEQN